MATGYKMRASVAEFVAPSFAVKLEAGKYVEYDKSIFRIWDDKISGEETAKEIQWDVDEATYACEEYGMAKFVSDKKKAQAVDPIRLDRDATKNLKRFHTMAREYRVNVIAGSTAIVTQTAAIAAAWAGAAGTPVTDILTGMSTVNIATTGYLPNRILIPTPVAIRAIQTTQWLSYFQYRGDVAKASDPLVSFVAGLRIFGLDPMLSDIYGLSEYKCTASDPTVTEQMWDDNVLLFYCEPTPSLETRTFMYSPFIKKDYFYTTREPRRRGVYHDIYSDIDELLVDASCAYLLTNCI